MEKLITLLVEWWFRVACWILVIFFPGVYLVQFLGFTLMKLLDWYGTSWSQVFTLPLECMAEIWSYARYGR